MNDPNKTIVNPPEGADDSLRTASRPVAAPGDHVSVPSLPADIPPVHSTPTNETIPPPERIGRYRIERVLGKGGFGLVYLARDDQLERLVAIKVPHRKLAEEAGVADIYLTEARTVAKLDHPHIVPVYDVGKTEQFPCYLVSRFIDGCDLAGKLKQSRLSHGDAVGVCYSPSFVSLCVLLILGVGFTPATELRDGERPVTLTDGGQPVAALFG